jgi:dsDNA-binding SOS-regulon protein
MEANMAVITQYVVQHKGVEKLVTTDKKEADKYDKMLETADNLIIYLTAKGIELDEAIAEELGILLSKNKESVMKIMKGAEVDGILEAESAEVVELTSAKK